MKNKYDITKEILKKYKQEHILSFIDKLTLENKEKIIEQILNIDFEELKELYEKTFEDIYVDLEELEPIIGVNPERLPKDKIEEYKKIGTEIIKSNKFAVSTMAGGQGTRLRTSKCERYI